MKNHFNLIMSAALIAGCITGSGCQNKQTTISTTNNNDNHSVQTFSNPDDAAKSSLDVLQALASNSKLNGVLSLSADEVKQLTVGKSIPLQELSYSLLLKTDSLQTLPAASSEISRLLYPLEINNVPKTTAIVSGSNNNWKLSSAGDNNYVALLSSQKAEGASDESVVEVPGLGVNFLRYAINGAVIYVPDRDLPDAKIMKGVSMPEQQALQSLTQYAREFDRLHGKEINDKKFTD